MNSEQNKKIKLKDANPNGKSADDKFENKNGKEDITPTAKAALKAFALTYKNAHPEKSKRG